MTIEERVLETYNVLHAIPELGFEEVKTSAYLAEKLASFGYEVKTGYGGTGIIGTLKSQQPGPTVGLRADMDALGYNINGELVAIHACGHDANSAMVLAAAEELAKRGITRGTLQILFQPAEEIYGSVKMIEDGAGQGLDMLFGIHLRPIQEAKLGQMTPALHHGASWMIRAYIDGKLSHGARPHLGINAINGAVAVIQAVNAIAIDPVIPSSVKATQIKGGGPSVNSIPESAEISFDIRSRENKTADEILEKVKVAIEMGAASVGAVGRFEILGGVPAADYDAEMIELARETILEELGEEGLMDEIITPGGEDFHYFTRHYPDLKTTYLGLGCDLTPGLHSADMTFNTDALKVGAKALVRMTEKALAR